MTPLTVHMRGGASVLAGGLAIGAGIWFLKSLTRYQASFKAAYRLLTAGVLLFSMAILQLSVLGVFNWWNTWYADSGVLIVPFVIAGIMMYGGVRKFSLLLELRTKATSWLLVTAVAVVFTAFSALIIKYLARYPFDGIETYNGTIAWGVTYITFGSIMAWNIRRAIGQSYKDAMRWMAIAITSYVVASMHEYVINFFVWNNGPYFQWGFQMIVWIITGFIYLEAARRFSLLTTPAKAQELEETGIKIADHDYVDSIIQVAGLASRPQDIDPMLDDLRLITAVHDEPKIKLSESEREKLTSVYEHLEEYLLTDEPVRHFSQEEVREHIRPAFRALLPSSPSAK